MVRTKTYITRTAICLLTETWSTGPLLPFRLAHITTRCPPLSQQALRLALTSAKKGKDATLYLRLHEIGARLQIPNLPAFDSEWAARQEEANKRELSRLEGELRGYKNNLIRESIRMGQEDLAQHLLRTGGPIPDPANPASVTTSGYNAAYQAFGKMRDYCTTPTHIASMTLHLITTGFLQAISAQQKSGAASSGHLNSVLSNANRLRTVGVKAEDQAKLTPIMHASIGIAYLAQSQYREAANELLAIPPENAATTLGTVHGIDFPKALASGNDIAIYGGLTALATMTRDELTNVLLGGPFRAFLELEPQIRKAATLFTTAKYRACLDMLERYYSDWSLDVFLGGRASASQPELGSHVDALFTRIREKSIVAYFTAFSEVSLTSLAVTFPPKLAADPKQALETELFRLIQSGALNARLDLVRGLLVAPKGKDRESTLKEARDLADEVERTLLLRLYRVNVALAGLEVPKGVGKGFASGGAGAGLGVGDGWT